MATKSDSQIQTDVMNELKWEPKVSHEQIGVAVHKGVVTLSGTVPNYAQKQAAEKAAMRVRGVKGVAEEIEVSLVPGHATGDTDIAEAAANALQWHVWALDNIQVKVENGWVTLTGNVDFQFQRNAAQDCVRYLHGVRGVTNDIALKPHVNLAGVRDSIEKALVRDAELEADNIQVIADGGSVTLTGKVHSWWERQAAGRAAWRAEGVHAVHNELQVV